MDSKIAGFTSATASAAPPEFGHYNAPELSSFQTIGMDEVLHAIRKSPSKQFLSDQFPTWLLKECANTVAPYLANSFNLSLVGGHFPSHWKHAIVTPPLKKAGLDDSNVSSYRPVSNLPHVSKILEEIVNRQLITHLDLNKLLPVVQSADSGGDSTETAVLKVYSMPYPMESLHCCRYSTSPQRSILLTTRSSFVF